MMITLRALCFQLLLAVAAAAVTDCRETCGDISIHYPFGVGRGCFREGFNLTCNRTHQPPKLFLGDGTIEVLNISLSEGTVHIDGKIMIMSTPSQDSNGSWRGLPDDGPFALSYTNNQFTAIGCGILARFMIPHSQKLLTFCGSICEDSRSYYYGEETNGVSFLLPENALCSGVGCCRTSIPVGLRSFDIQFRPLNQTPNWAEEFVNKAFVVEKDWFSRNVPMLKNLTSGTSVAIPAVLDWKIGNSSCEEAKSRSDFGCLGANSKCVNVVGGYRCNCSSGFEGNPYLPDGCKDIDECQQPKRYPCGGTCTNMPGTCNCQCPEGTTGNATVECIKDTKDFPVLPAVFIGLGSGVCLLSLLIGIALPIHQFKIRRAKKIKEKFFKQNRGLLLQQLISSNTNISERMKIFKSEELEKATNNFDRARILGRGGHGTVYKGILSDQRVVAIKKSTHIVQAEIDQFINEVVILSQINHRNVVKLFGCCLETEVPLLVYEFISNGTLSDHLHVEDRHSLSWDDRLRIAVETSRALAYLHSSASISVFHRDVKSANVLLDDRFTAKISDFGASRSVPFDQTGITTVIHGTYGYLDPEYHYTGRLTEKSDVYSFGVILVELLTRKSPVSRYSRGEEERSLVAHFSQLLREDDGIFRFLDPQVVEEGKREEVGAVAELAEMCVRSRGEERPAMKEVEVKLEALRGFRKQSTHIWVAPTPRLDDEMQSLPAYPPTESSSSDVSRQYSLEEEAMLSSTFPR
ncbi:wall-associated receptor kinase 5-like [Typha latifolia]|uniref:wall-associated receptor kinase 5-like n=1 Tax=Typha latifolia TaxID=4733 RepID=UPI003C302C4A